MRYFLFGSMFIEELSKYISETEISGKLTDTLVGLRHTYFSENKSVREKYNNNLKETLERSDAEYFVFDLRCFCYLYDISPLPRLENFANIIASRFSSKKIILIATFHTKWYVIDTQLRKKKRYKGELMAMSSVGKAEKLFVDKTGAQLCDVAKFYFGKKMSGFRLADYMYEDECYMDIADKLRHIDTLSDLTKPVFAYSVDRYLRYYKETVHLQAFEVFLNREWMVDSFLLDSPADFVKDNYKNYISLKNMESLINGNAVYPSETICIDENFAKIFYAYRKLAEEDFCDLEADYSLPFVNAIVPGQALSWIRKKANSMVENGKQINAHNAGFYFALLKGLEQEEALKYVERSTCLTPTLMDIYGSCISRTILGERFTGNTTISSNLYWFHVPPFRSNNEKFYLNYFNKEGLKDRELIVKYQLEGMVNDIIKDSDSDWLLIDLCSIYSVRSYIHDGLIFNDYFGVAGGELKVQSIRIEDTLKVMGGMDNMLAAIAEWSDVIYEKFKNHIILVDTHYCCMFIGDDNRLYGKKKRSEMEKNNIIIKQVYNFLRSRLGCYCIELTDKFLADDMGFLYRSPVHYELSFYREMFRHIENIVKNEPVKKLYADYSNSVRIDRIVRLIPKNDIRLLRNYFDNPVDEIVLQLPVNVIKKRRDIILQWYDKQLSTKEEILEDLDSRQGMERLRGIIVDMGCLDKISIEEAQLKYEYPYHKNDDMRKLARHFVIHFDGNGADEGSMEEQKVVYGSKTPIHKNQFKKAGFVFKGWQPIRRSDGKTGYTIGKTNRYYREGEQPEGMRRLLYKDGGTVMACSKVDDDIVDFIAQWEVVQD